MSSSAITADLLLEIKGFVEGIKTAQDKANEFSKNARKGGDDAKKGFLSMAAAVAAGTAALGILQKALAGIKDLLLAMPNGIKGAFDVGGQFSDIAAQVGSTAGQVRILSAAFENNGMGRAEIAKTINKMSKSMNDATKGLASATIAFGELGIDPEEIIKKDPVSAFKEIMEAMGGIENESKRVAVAMDIFGRSGGKLGVLLKDKKAMANAEALIGGQAEILDEHAEQFDRASDVLNQTGTKFQGFFMGIGAQIIEQILPAIEWFNQLDLTSIGNRFGDALARGLDVAIGIVQVLSTLDLGQLAYLFGEILKYGVLEAMNALHALGMAAMSATTRFFVEGLKVGLRALGQLGETSFWKGMLQNFIGIARIFSGFLMKAVGNMIVALKNGTGKIGEKLFAGVGEMMQDAGTFTQEEGKDNLDEARVTMSPVANVMEEQLKGIGSRIGDAFKETYAGTEKLFDTGDQRAQVNAFGEAIAEATQGVRKARLARAAAAGAGEEDGGGEAAAGGNLATINGRLSGAINTIVGRSANAVIAAEAAKTSVNTERTAKAAEQIAKNTTPRPGATPTPYTGDAPTVDAGRFA